MVYKIILKTSVQLPDSLKHYSMKLTYLCKKHEDDITAVTMDSTDHFLIERDQLGRRGVRGEVGWQQVTQVSVD